MKRKFAGRVFILSTVLVLVFSAGGYAPAQAAGPYTHGLFAEVALEKLAELDANIQDKDYTELIAILNKYPGVVNYGALFPDMGYTHWPNETMAHWSEGLHDTTISVKNFCAYYKFLTDHQIPSTLENYKKFYLDDAESDNPVYEHQVPAFRQSLISQLLPYIHKTPRTAEDEKKIAFLFGLISHQEADTPFHAGLYDDKCSGQSGVVTYLLETGDPNIPNEVEHPLLELEIDYFLFGYDHRAGGGNYIELSYYSNELKQIIRAASSATPGMTPAPDPMVCTVIIPNIWTYCTEDRFDTAQDRMLAMIGNIIQTGKNTPPDDGFKNWLVNYSRGGIVDGAELTAVVWAKTWDDLMKDYSAPTTTLSLAPEQADGNNGWYVTQPVMVALSATGALQPLVTNYRDGNNPLLQYTEPFAVTTDGIHYLYYFSTNAQGMREAAKEQIIKIDLTSPTVNAWTDQAQYTRFEPITIHFTGSDAISGLASITGEFNNQPVTDGQVVDLLWLPMGTYTLNVRAEDMAGNVTEASQSIELIANLKGLKGTVERLCEEGYITKHGTCNELLKKVDAAIAAQNRGNNKTAANLLNALQNAVKAQSGKSISKNAADLLLGDSNYLKVQLSK